jgi:hypothetical protein
MTGKRRRVVTWDDKRLRLLSGFCTVSGRMITVTSEYGKKRTPLNGMAPFDLARIMLRELAADERAATGPGKMTVIKHPSST